MSAKHSTKRYLTMGAIVLASMLVLAGWTFFGQHGSEQYRTVALQKGDIVSTISASGTANAVVTVQVGSQVSGSIKELYVNYNSKVQKGQLIARIDPDMFQAKVDQAQANMNATRAAVITAQANVKKADAGISNAQAAVEEAKANVEQAKVTAANAKVYLERRVQLFQQGILSQEDRDTAQTSYDANTQAMRAAQARLTAAQDMQRAAEVDREAVQTQLAGARAQVQQTAAALQQAQIDMQHTFIRAPVDGTVISRSVDVGQTVAASLQTPTLFLIAQDLTKMQVDTSVDEADIGRVQMGQPVSFSVDAYPGQRFRGTVAEVRQAPITVQNVVTYDVVVTADNQGLKLLPGMTANVSILVDRRQDVLRVPNAALLFTPPGAAPPARPAPQRGQGFSGPGAGPHNGAGTGSGAGGRGGPGGQRPGVRQPAAQTVWVLDSGKPRAVSVQLGLSDGTYSEVTAGDLKEGQLVIVGLASKDESAGAGQSRSSSSFGPRGPRF